MSNSFINFYGRRSGHIGEKSRKLLDNHLGFYSISVSDSKITLHDNIDKFDNINLEIGFGRGDFIYQQAKLYPNTLFVGVEVFLNGVGHLLNNIVKNNISNIKIYNGNIYNILSYLSPNQFDNLYILFPDPWHKKKHNKRRIINQLNLDIFFNILKPNGSLYFFTDHKDYAQYSLENIKEHNKFSVRYGTIDDGKNCPIDDFSTKYHQKALLDNRDIYYFIFKKIVD